jgi:hypothetical protein
MTSLRVVFRFVLTVWLCLTLLAGLPGCSNVRYLQGVLPMPLSEQERPRLGVVGVAKAQFQPEAKFDTFATGKGSGALKGAAIGAGEGFLIATYIFAHGNCNGEACGALVLLWLAAAGIGTTVGAVYGAVTGVQEAVSQKEAERIEAAARQTLDELRVQERIRDAVVAEARDKAQRELVQLEDFGPTSPGQRVDYTPLKSQGIDAVLEVSITEIGFETPPRQVKYDRADPPLFLAVTCRVRLILLADDKVLYEPNLEMRSEARTLADWEADDSKAFFDELDLLTKRLAEKVVEDVFITSVLPVRLD